MGFFNKLLGRGTQGKNSAENSVDIGALKAAADSGDAEAQHQLAICYRGGEGVTKDQQKGDELDRLSAENGCTEAQFGLSTSYLVQGQLEESFFWAEKAANGGQFKGLYLLGLAYKTGQLLLSNMEIDLDLAEKCFRIGADKDHADSQYYLAETLAEKNLGNVALKSWIEIHHYMYQAAQNGQKDAIAYIKKNKVYLDKQMQKAKQALLPDQE